MLSYPSILLFFISIFTIIVNVENSVDLNKLNSPVSQKHDLSNDSFTPATKGSVEKGINNSINQINLGVYSEGSGFIIKHSDVNMSTTIIGGLADSTHDKEPKSEIRNATQSSNVLNSATVDNNGKVAKSQESIAVLQEKSVSEINVGSEEPKTVPRNTTTKSIVLNSPVVSFMNNSNTKATEISKSNSTTEASSTTTKKPVPKKPLITIGSEAFPDADIPINSKEALPSTPTTTDSVVHTNPQYYQSSVNQSKGQPGFIIPIVITLFALPLLVLIGYQAIRRGKEAWRNRHYRRMDFLIDGMYND